MKGLFLYGISCQDWVWDGIKDKFNSDDVVFVQYPNEITKKCNSILDLSNWVVSTYIGENKELDFIVGHSMGGLMALQISTIEDIKIDKTIIIESFFKPTSKFFQNLLYSNTNKRLEEKVMKMLKEESSNYTKALKNDLIGNFDFTPYIKLIRNKIYCLYGDRGNNDYEYIKKELNLSKSILEKIEVSLIHNACHFPMLENKDKTINSLKRIIKK